MSKARKLFKDVGFEVKEIGMSVYEGFYITYQGELVTITFIDNTKTVKVSFAGTDVNLNGLREDLSNPIKVQKEELGWFNKKGETK